ncbi:alpha-amylase family glycosyl hydrolase [Nakamurella flava]|nr:alpha-amylase family glycosyl hydrolase [Nakamurella flava]
MTRLLPVVLAAALVTQAMVTPASAAPADPSAAADATQEGATFQVDAAQIEAAEQQAAAAPAQAGRPGPTPGHGNRAMASLRTAETDENFYFVMADRFANGDPTNDRGGIDSDDPSVTGFDPTRKGYYNGGDLQGLRDRLDYIEGLGTTAIWLTPSFKNKPVQGTGSNESAGYHGYWITDFTQIDPHLGTNDDLAALIQDAHARGIKVYFDIITNHTADVIKYQNPNFDPSKPVNDTNRELLDGGAYVSKDSRPYTDAQGRTFDDRDVAGTDAFPELDATTSFPYTPVNPAGETDVKVPAWLNDVTRYHNRGDTSFVGENSQYGDFFGLDDLFTEDPVVVNGMIDIYGTWIRDFGVDGFRIDTVKHVDDQFWQAFSPAALKIAHDAGKKDFFMFGEVYDTTRPFTSHYTTAGQLQAVLDFPFQDAARSFASKNGSAADLQTFFADDDWYTDADSNAYQLPTFLGNHDMGHIGYFIQSDNPDAGDATWLAKDRLAHQLMYLVRGNPVVYFGDEQGFTGTGGDQLARQTLFASRVAEYLDDDLIGTDRTHAVDNYETTHPLYRSIADLAALTKKYPALRNGAQQNRYAAEGPGIYAFSRMDRTEQREFVVAVNNSTTAQTATLPTYATRAGFSLVYGAANGVPDTAKTDRAGKLTVSVPSMSTVVYRADGTIPAARWAPNVKLMSAAPAADTKGRMEVTARVGGTGFAEVTFQARIAGGQWQTIGTDDNAPYRVFHDVSALDPGTKVQYRAAVLVSANNGKGLCRSTGVLSAKVPAPGITIDSPTEGGAVHTDGPITISAVTDPEKASNVVTFERSVAGGAWTAFHTDDSSPAYVATDDLAAAGFTDLPNDTPVRYRATVSTPSGASSSAEIGLTVKDRVTTATVHYYRPDQQYLDWGLHLWGGAVDPATLAGITWDTSPLQRTGVDADGWATYAIPLVDDLQRVNFILHRPNGDQVPATREPGGDRSFVPVQSAEIWLVAGDPTVHISKPAVG